MDTAAKNKHLLQVVAELPKGFRKTATISHGHLAVGAAKVTIEGGRWGERRTMKADFTYSLKDDLGVKPRRWRHRERDHLFAYDKVAAYVTKHLKAYDNLLLMREEGEVKAQSAGQKIVDAFNQETLLGALNLKVTSVPVNNTTTGAVHVRFRGEGARHSLRSDDGETFSGKLDVYNLLPEQVVAIMAVLRADQLNLLEMLNLADDSILGPVIRRLTDKENPSE